ncbi:hypothetical protein HK102_009472 [Quaeritorhiza haematococci]|nr:hypothetical protein HK102_009472 [Quaeritorhiza haematococci]
MTTSRRAWPGKPAIAGRSLMPGAGEPKALGSPTGIRSDAGRSRAAVSRGRREDPRPEARASLSSLRRRPRAPPVSIDGPRRSVSTDAREGAAGGLDVLAAGVAADDRLADVTRQGVAEDLEFLRRGRHVPAGRVRDLDEVDPDRRVADQLAQGPCVLLADVHAADADVSQRHPGSPGQRMATRRGHDLGDRPPRGDRDELLPLRVRRRAQADGQSISMSLAGKAVDLRDQPHSADRDGLRGHRPRRGASQEVGRRHDVVIVQERLAHPHEHGARHPPPLSLDQFASLEELVDDLPGLEIAPGRHPGGRAESAAHRAADLRREADADRAFFVEGDQDRFQRQPLAGPESELLESVLRRDDRPVERDPGVQGPQGDPGPTGPIGPQGPTGVVQTAFATGTMANPNAGDTFIGPTVDVTIQDGDQIYIQATATMGSFISLGAGGLTLSLNYASGGGALTPVVSYPGLSVGPGEKTIFPLNALITGIAPGTYTVGVSGASIDPMWTNQGTGTITAMVLRT